MNFEHTEQQKMLRQLTRDYAVKRLQPMAKEVDDNDRFPIELMKELSELGLLSTLVPTKYGGMGVDHVSHAIVIEELVRVLPTVASIVGTQNSMTATPLIEWGTEEQRQRLMGPSMAGDLITAIAVSEPNIGSNSAGIETMAVKQGSDWILNGCKTWCTQGYIADVILLVAQTDKTRGHKGMIALLFDANTPGFEKFPVHKLGFHGTAMGELHFDDCKVPEKNQVGKIGQGINVIMSGLDEGRLTSASYGVGLSQACVDASIDYAKQRIQFGKSIGGFQLIQSMIAEMVVDTEAARLLTYQAGAIMDTGKRKMKETSYAKFFATEAAQRTSYKALQIHGAYGYTDECPVQRFFRDARSTTLIEGTSEIQKLSIGRELLGLNAFV